MVGQKRVERGLVMIDATYRILVSLFPPLLGGKLYPQQAAPPSPVSRGGEGHVWIQGGL